MWAAGTVTITIVTNELKEQGLGKRTPNLLHAARPLRRSNSATDAAPSASAGPLQGRRGVEGGAGACAGVRCAGRGPGGSARALGGASSAGLPAQAARAKRLSYVPRPRPRPRCCVRPPACCRSVPSAHPPPSQRSAAAVICPLPSLGRSARALRCPRAPGPSAPLSCRPHPIVPPRSTPCEYRCCCR